MKTKTLIIFPIVLFVGIILIQLLYPSVNVTWFTIKHIMIYMLLTYIVFFISILIYRELKRSYKPTPKRLVTMRVVTGLLVTTLVLVIGSLQIRYIDDYLIPPLRGCIYYDRYENIVYTSQYENICPDITDMDYNIREGSYDVLTFTVLEEAYGGGNIPFLTENIYDSQGELYTTMRIEYNDTGFGMIKNVEMTSYLNEEFISLDDNYPDLYSSTLYKKTVENTFASEENDIKEYEISSTITEWEVSSTSYEDYIGTMSIEDVTPLIRIQKATYIEQAEPYPQTTAQYMFDVTFEETTIDGENTETVVFGSGTEFEGEFVMTLDKTFEYLDPISIDYKRDTEGYSRNFRNNTETYTIPSYLHQGESVTGMFLYRIFLHNDQRQLAHLESYTRLVENNEQGKFIDVEYYANNDGTFYINHLDTTKVSKNPGYTWDYHKAEQFSTYKVGSKYRDPYNNGESFKSVDITRSNYNYGLKQLFDSKHALLDYATKERITTYQRNHLFDGFGRIRIYLT